MPAREVRVAGRFRFAAQLMAITAVAIVAGGQGADPSASSHREAPLISQDPLADNTDVYAFVSPASPDKVTLISNFIPLQLPASGPNFWKFDDNVLYEIMVDNTGDAVEDITFQFRFRTETRNQNTFLYNTGMITSLDDPDWNVRQFYPVTRIDGPRRQGRGQLLAEICRRHRSTLACVRSPTTLRSRHRPCARCRMASMCSPASATRVST